MWDLDTFVYKCYVCNATRWEQARLSDVCSACVWSGGGGAVGVIQDYQLST